MADQTAEQRRARILALPAEDRAALADIIRQQLDRIPGRLAKLREDQAALTDWLAEFAPELLPASALRPTHGQPHDSESLDGCGRQPRPATITWNDLKPGVIVRYRHVGRARRLAGKPLFQRLGRIEDVNPQINYGNGQVTITVLNKDGSPNRSLGRVILHYPLDFIEGVVEQPVGEV